MDCEYRLSTYVEVISDDFQSTFSVVDDDTLSNMMGFPGDKESLTKIIKNYIPDCEVEFEKTNQFDSDYDIYLIKCKPYCKETQMKYTLIGYKYNKQEKEVARYEQDFYTLDVLKDKLCTILPNFENYEIYEDEEMIETNFKRKQMLV